MSHLGQIASSVWASVSSLVKLVILTSFIPSLAGLNEKSEAELSTELGCQAKITNCGPSDSSRDSDACIKSLQGGKGCSCCGPRQLIHGHTSATYVILSAQERAVLCCVTISLASAAPTPVKAMIGRCSLGDMLSLLLHSDSWSPQYPLALWLPIDRLQGQVVPEHGPHMTVCLTLFTVWAGQ